MKIFNVRKIKKELVLEADVEIKGIQAKAILTIYETDFDSEHHLKIQPPIKLTEEENEILIDAILEEGYM